MGQEDLETRPDGIAGLPVDEAVDAVVAREEVTPETARRALGHVAEEGVVSQDAVASTLAHLSKVVSTPETRAELAAIELSEAREASEHVDDLDVVAARLEAFEDRLAAVEAEVAALGPALQSLVGQERDGRDLYEVARGVQRLTEDANDAHFAADELAQDIEAFERWVGDAERRAEEFEGDLDVLADALDELTTTLDGLADPSSGQRDGDPGVVWADAALRHRVFGALLADLRAELADLRTWRDRESVDASGELDDAADRLDALTERRAALGERLDALAREAWRETHGETLAALETDLEDVEPPVDWATVRDALEARREDLDG